MGAGCHGPSPAAAWSLLRLLRLCCDWGRALAGRRSVKQETVRPEVLHTACIAGARVRRSKMQQRCPRWSTNAAQAVWVGG